MKKLLLSLILLSSLVKINFAETVPPEKAKSVATSFFSSILQNNNTNQRASPELELVLTEGVTATRGRNAEPAYYIFNNSGGKGFVIVAGDDELDPVIGYSVDNTMNINDLPPSFVAYMEVIKLSVEEAKKNPSRATLETKAKWNTSHYAPSAAAKVIVSPLVKASWGQGYPYNDHCPITTDFERTLVGCVAVAMGQIMHYWNYPERGSGKKNGFDFGNTTYQWNQMRYSLNNSSPKNEIFAVAQLLRHCGASVDMDYGVKSSGAFPSSGAFEKYFGYDKSAKLVHKYDYSNDKWIDLLKDNLDEFQPILYSGYAEKKGKINPKYSIGHAWVCDGYDSQDKFHMNWGWNGSNSDGFYVITDLKPNSNEFRYRNDAIVELKNPNRLELSSIKSSKSLICSKTSFECSVKDVSKIAAYLWTVPKGWIVSGVESKGDPISLGNKVTIQPKSTSAVSAQSEIRIYVQGITSYGEKTKIKSIAIGTGKPSYSHAVELFPGEEVHTFTATQGSIIQHSKDGKKWVSAGRIYSDQAYGATRYIYIRASNSCGETSATRYKLNRQIDPNDKHNKLVFENTNQSLTIDLFPVPATDRVFIQTNEKVQKINCFNAFGQTVEVELENQGFSVSHLPKGVYILSITTTDGYTEKKKFMKE